MIVISPVWCGYTRIFSQIIRHSVCTSKSASGLWIVGWVFDYVRHGHTMYFDSQMFLGNHFAEELTEQAPDVVISAANFTNASSTHHDVFVSQRADQAITSCS